MFAVDRSIPDSCVWRTDACDRCYNLKLYNVYPAMVGKDARNEIEWAAISGEQIARELNRKRKPTDRFRLMTRGETLRDQSDFARVADIASHNPGRLIWCPTRAWRDDAMRVRILRDLFPFRNLIVLASTDPGTTAEEDAALAADGFSTMYFGDDNVSTTPAGRPWFYCPKTWRKLKGHCGICKAGCFAPSTLGRRVDVHLREH